MSPKIRKICKPFFLFFQHITPFPFIVYEVKPQTKTYSWCCIMTKPFQVIEIKTNLFIIVKYFLSLEYVFS
uniref:hypothetical protein n=1 Tax=Elizabethkingia anophelis TaxID=1117645 RepID=UPI0038922F98